MTSFSRMSRALCDLCLWKQKSLGRGSGPDFALSLLEQGVEPYHGDFPSRIKLWLYSDYNLPFCWLCPKAPVFVLDLRFCVHDLVPLGISVTGVLLVTPAPGMSGGHPSVVGCHPGESYQSLLYQAKQPIPMLGLIFLRPCHQAFCTHLVKE